MNSELWNLGWDDFFESHFRPYVAAGLGAARVVLEYNHLYRVLGAGGELLADVAGRLRHEVLSRSELPAVGDWVAIEPRPDEARATIHGVLPRKSKFVRKAAGTRTEAQIVGANIDTVFLVTSLDRDFNLRRLERYLTVARESGASPVIVLSKADLCDDVEGRLAELRTVAAGVPAHAVSVTAAANGPEELAPYFGTGRTVALLGSSGVGKSTLINHLIGRETQKVREVRAHDGRGQHTTTRRELIPLPQGGFVLDTPGMRELHLWAGGESSPAAFDDVEALVRGCRFTDCRHRKEPGCAVREALEAGTLDEARYQSYEKLQKELEHAARRQDVNAQTAEKKRWKKLARLAAERGRAKRR